MREIEQKESLLANIDLHDFIKNDIAYFEEEQILIFR